MNIVLINPEFPSRSFLDHGGIATYTYCMANALADAGHSVHVLAKHNTVPDALHDAVRFHTFTHEPVPRFATWLDRLLMNEIVWERGYSLAAKHAVLEIHKTSPVDIVEIADYNGLAYEFSQPMPFPVIIHFHTPTEMVDLFNQKKITGKQKRWYAFEEKALKKAAGFRCPSNALKTMVCKRYGIGPDKVRVIGHPLDTAPYEAVKRSALTKSSVDILFTGRLERRKGGEIMLGNIERILNISPLINLTFAGELDMGDAGNFRNPIERKLTEEERHRIWFLGPTKRGDLPVLYRQSDIFLMPSLFENAPYALLEAMASHTPVVAANTSGIAELISNGENGLLFDIGDENGISSCIRKYLETPDKGMSYANTAYNYIKENHDPALIAKNTIEFYTSIIETFAGQMI